MTMEMLTSEREGAASCITLTGSKNLTICSASSLGEADDNPKQSGACLSVCIDSVTPLVIFLLAVILPPSVHSQIQFSEVTTVAGVIYSGESYGASWGDFNGDGKPDLWVNNHLQPPSLFQNNGDGTFTDVRADIYIADIASDTHGGAWGDFDNDGDQDLLVVAGAQQGVGSGPNLMLVNENGLLEDRASLLGLDFPLGRSRTPLWFDWNRDGQLDALIVTKKRSDGVVVPTSLFEQTAGGFTDITAAAGLQSAKSGNYAQLSYLASAETPALAVHGAWSYPQNVYSFDTGVFEDVSSVVGLGTGRLNVWDSVVADFNGDNRPDLFLTKLPDPRVASDVQQDGANALKARLVARGDEKRLTFRSTGSVTFNCYSVPKEKIHIGSGGYSPPVSRPFTLDPADPAVWGLMEFSPGTDDGFYIGYNTATQTWDLSRSHPNKGVVNLIGQSTAPISDLVPQGFDPAANSIPDELLINQGGVLQDFTQQSGLSGDTSCQSVVAGDFDNDMDVDLYMVCSSPVANLPNILYENLGNGSFVPVEGAGGVTGTDLGRGETVVAADYDQDGFLDLFLTNGQFNPPFNQGPSQLFRNQGNGNHWIEIDLVGVASNRDGIGAQVYVTAGGVTQWREQGGGMHRHAQNQRRLHFGLGANSTIGKVVVSWPSGIQQVVANVAVDQVVQIIESVTDGDGDGVFDHLDNCLRVANVDQRDTNGDGYGNACDADLDNNGSVGWSDLAELERVYRTNNADADLDGNGVVDRNDRLLLESYMFGSPGPSGLLGESGFSVAEGGITFTEVSSAAGISYSGQSVGASWGDFNGDGCPDIWASNHYSYPSLYINQCDGSFRDAAPEVIMSYPQDDSHGAAWGDFDNDGDQDLFEASGDFFNTLYVNNNLTLTDQAAFLGVQGCPLSNNPCPLTRARTPLWLDWNRDGRLDLFLSHQMKAGDPPSTLFEWSGGAFINVNADVGVQVNNSADFANISDLSGDGQMDLLVHGSNFPNAVYDLSQFPFEKFGASSFPAVGGVTDIVLTDVDGDLDTDIVLAKGKTLSDVMQADDRTIQVRIGTNASNTVRGISFRSDGDVFFDLHPFLSASQVFVGAAGNNPASLPFTLAANDSSTWGLQDVTPGPATAIYVGYEPATKLWSLIVKSSSTRWVIGVLKAMQPISEVSRINFDAFQANKPPVILLQDNGAFVDATSESGLTGSGNCSSVVTGDFDNDMDSDLYFVCNRPAGNISNLLYENDGTGKFSLSTHAGSPQGKGDSVTTGDYDGDGFLDLFLTNSDWTPPLTGPDQLLKNDGNGNHWIALDLEGVVSNRDGNGGRAFVTAGGVTQIREQGGGMHRFSQNHQRLHFGLGTNKRVERLEVHWPSGIVQKVRNIVADQVLRVIEEATPNLMGQPAYVAGIDEGVYLWKETFDGPYHLRVTGNGERSIFSIKLVSEESLESVVPVQLEWPDELLSSVFGFALEARVSVMDDGIDFQLKPGAKALLSVEQDGVANPRQLHVGAGGGPLSPVGWILPLSELPLRPTFVDTEALGLFVGQGNVTGLVEARWSGDGPRRLAAVSMIASQPLLDVVPQGLELDDTFEQTTNSVQVAGWLGPLSDGLDIYLPEGSDVGVAYRQDGLFPPHRVNPGAGALGTPNGYWLPAAEPYGAPSYDPATEAGLFLWKDREGSWHLRVTAGGGEEQYVGRIVSDLPAILVEGVGIEGGDTLDTSDPTRIEFHLEVYNNGQDGTDFLFPADAVIRLELDPPGSDAGRIQVGEDRWPVESLPLTLSRW